MRLRSDFAEREVRALVDAGSQRSYVLSATANDFLFRVKGIETVIHSLFGGANTARYKSCKTRWFIFMYFCSVRSTIFNEVTAIHEGIWSGELRKLNINVMDMNSSGQIEVLIGSHAAGKLLTGNVKQLSSGMTAVEIRLGWTVMGKLLSMKQSNNTGICTAISLLIDDNRICDLWELDVCIRY